MLPDDWRDGFFASLGLVALVFVGVFLKFGAGNIFAADTTFNDDVELALLSTLRIETAKGDLADVIVLNENDESYSSMIEGIATQNLNFAIKDTEYFVRITYPDGDKLIFSPFTILGILSEEHFKKIKTITKEMVIPSLNEGVIKIELVVGNE